MTRWRTLVQGTVICGLITLISLIGQAKADPNVEFIPEYYFYDPAQPHCTFKLDLRDDSFDVRRSKTLDIIDFSYQLTDAWTRKFVLAGINYVNFAYLHFISFDACNASQKNLADIEMKFGLQQSDFVVREYSNLDASAKMLEEFGPLGLFIRYRSKDEIARCLIKITINQTGISDNSIFKLLNEFQAIRAKYRPPLADVNLVNNRLYLLFSRQCEKMRKQYEEISYLFKKENLGTESVGNTDFMPSPDEYLFTRLGSK
jgi:hypothetical protein